MTTGQAPIRIKTGNALDVEDTTSNVAINQAMMEALSAANIDGKDVYPNYVGAQHLSAADAIIHGAFKAGSMMIGAGGVNISSAEDGETPTTGLYMGGSLFSLYKSGVSQVTFDGQTGNASFKGAVYAESGSFPGSLVTGNISVGSGGVTISNDGGASGIYIGGNQIYAKYGGVTTVLIDGASGKITCSKFELTADSSSKITLNQGTHIFSEGIQVGSTTLGGINSVANSALSIANDAHGDAATAYNLADSAIKPGGGVQVDGQKYITTIDMSNGIVIRSGNATARTQMTSNGIAIYNSSGTLVVQADHTNGVWINNASDTPSVQERLSLAYDSTEKMWIAAVGISGTFYENWIRSPSSDLYISAGAKLHLQGYDASYNSCVILRGGPGIYWGSGTPSMSADVGSIYLSTGGSFWIMQAGGWRRIDNWVS